MALRLNPMTVVWQCTRRLASQGYHGLAKWDEQTPYHWKYGKGDSGEDRDRWHEYYFTLDSDEDLSTVIDLWKLVAGTIRKHYRRRLVVASLLGLYELDEDTLMPIKRITKLHHGEWRSVVTVRQARNVESAFGFEYRQWELNYRETRRLHGFYIFAIAPHNWQGWDVEGPRCVREWRKGRRSA